jgi:TIGR03009 family protein
MTLRFGFWAAIILALLAAPLAAQEQPWRGAPDEPRQPAVDPRDHRPLYQPQPAVDPRDERVPYQAQPPQAPTIERRDASQRPTVAPFTLAPEQQAQVDWVLQQWEKQGAGVKTIECGIVRFEYDQVFGQAGKPKFIDEGRIWYTAPDKGRFEIYGERAEKWICDGKSIFQYDYKERKLYQNDLPPELQGKAIAKGPMPFLFGSTAADLRDRYWIRLTEPPPGTKGRIWLEAYPRFQQDRANFVSAEMILDTATMQPVALLVRQPNKSAMSYRFSDLKVNAKGMLLLGPLLQRDPFETPTPSGWKRIVERIPPAANHAASPDAARPIPLDNPLRSLGNRPPEGVRE